MIEMRNADIMRRIVRRTANLQPVACNVWIYRDYCDWCAWYYIHSAQTAFGLADLQQ